MGQPANIKSPNKIGHFARAAAFQHKLRTILDAAVGYLRIITTEWKSAEYDVKELQPLVRKTKLLLNAINNANRMDDDQSVTIDLSSYLLSTEQLEQLREDTLQLSRMAEKLEKSSRITGKPRLREPARNLVKISLEMIRGLERELEFFTGKANTDRLQDTATIDITTHFISEAVNEINISKRDNSLGKQTGTVLLADDDRFTREILSEQLKERGYKVVTAKDGKQAMQALKALSFDLVLLDIIMPEMNGYQVLEAAKQHPKLKDIPILILSAFNKTDSISHCIELGADDYLTKPIVPKLLFARMHASLEQKRLKDRANAYLEQINREQERTNELLLNILPATIATQLSGGKKLIADHFDQVTVLFCDISGFTEYASNASADDVVRQLNDIFAVFDVLVVEHGVEKIKTLGDGYLAVSGLPQTCDDHAQRAADLALAMMQAMQELNANSGSQWQLRIGLNTGAVTAGVIGKFKFAYDVWGDTVNVASRMESTGIPGRIQLSSSTRALIENSYQLEDRGIIEVKGKGPMNTWFLNDVVAVG